MSRLGDAGSSLIRRKARDYETLIADLPSYETDPSYPDLVWNRSED